MDKLARPKKLAFVTLAALAILLAVSAPGQARGMGGHSFGGGHAGAAFGHPGFDGHHDFDGHHFDGHHDFDGHHFDRGVHGRFGFGPVFPYYGYYPSYEPPAYWYYCPSYGAYYPNVQSCPEAWVPVPAS